jgi:hypothetical protein
LRNYVKPLDLSMGSRHDDEGWNGGGGDDDGPRDEGPDKPGGVVISWQALLEELENKTPASV